MRSPVQSWVPLQESTAETLCFFRLYTLKTARKGQALLRSHRKLAFKVAVVVMSVSERSERWLEGTVHGQFTGFPHLLSWVQCERAERIRRSRPAATETSWVPLQESTAETLCFFSFLYPQDCPKGPGYGHHLMTASPSQDT